jgi:GNAT superfamily N-acetyltransferase
MLSIESVRWEDIPALAKIGNDAMKGDRNTELKAQSRVPFRMGEVVVDCLNMWLLKENIVCTKAVDTETGEILGGINWGFSVFDKNDISRNDPGPKPSSSTEPEKMEILKEKEAGIKRLEELTNSDMKLRQGQLMPPGTKCMFILMFMVSPLHQRKGVGSALLKWGTDIADRHSVYTWVHSSDGAWRVFQKHGFETIYTLDVDLDEYAPFPPVEGRGIDGRWGQYIFRYMKRLPLSNQIEISASQMQN